MAGIKCRRCERPKFVRHPDIVFPTPNRCLECEGDYYPPLSNSCACCRRYVRGIV